VVSPQKSIVRNRSRNPIVVILKKAAGLLKIKYLAKGVVDFLHFTGIQFSHFFQAPVLGKGMEMAGVKIARCFESVFWSSFKFKTKG